MWCLAMGGMESTGEDREWFLNELEQQKRELGSKSWDVVLGVLREVIWFEDVHTVIFWEVCVRVEPIHGSDDYLGGSRFGRTDLFGEPCGDGVCNYWFCPWKCS